MTKKTSKEVAAIAGRVLDGDALTPYLPSISDALRQCGLPLNDRAVLALQNRLEAALAPLIDDMQALAGSAMAQKVKEPKPIEGFSEPKSE